VIGRRRRLLTIAHSYAVGMNRRLAHELALAGGWDVTAVAPARFRGDFAWHTVEPLPGEACAVAPVPAHFTRRVHVMLYGRALASLLAQPWDLVHAWEEPYIAAGAQIAAWTPAGVPLVYATFQNIAKRYPPPFGWFERYALARADAMIAFGQTGRELLEARGFRGRPVRVIPPGVDVAHFRPDGRLRAATLSALGWADDTPTVGFLGRFVPEKGLALLMSALDRVPPPWRALLVGSGPLEPELRAWAARHGDRVRVATGVLHDQVAAYLNAMDLLCAPSQTTAGWREQFGRMLIEAFACGVPVVASDSGEIPWVVADAGVIVGERDAGAWTRAIADLVADPERRRGLAALGLRRASSVFAWSVVARQHVDFFEELVAVRGTADRRAV